MGEQLEQQFDIGASGSTYQEKYGFFDKENYAFRSKKGLNHEVVEEISWMKNEPDWMRDFRHRSLDIFYKKPMPQWGGNLNDINFDDIYYFVRASEKQGRNWDEVPRRHQKHVRQAGHSTSGTKVFVGRWRAVRK